MQKIDLNLLPKYSPWPSRLVGSEPCAPNVKNHENLYKEYNDDKYGKLLSAATFEEADDIYWGPDDASVISRHNELFLTSKRESRALRNKLFVDSLRPLLNEVRCVVELGAGFGQMVRPIQKEYPHLTYIAGEYTPNGVTVGKQLLPGVQFSQFDFSSDDWNVFDGIEQALVLTVHSVEMLPDATLFVEKIKAHASHIHTVVDFEPVYEDDGSMLSLLRQRYIQVNGYCKNILQSIPDAKVEKDFFGLNPLFPESRIEWKP